MFVNAILIIVLDSSDSEFLEQLEVTEKLLGELGASDKPTLYVFNKCDKGLSGNIPNVIDVNNAVFISAITGQGIEQFCEKLESLLLAGRRKIKYLIPHVEQFALNKLYKEATVESTDYIAEGVLVVATVDEKMQGIMKKYEIK